MSMGMGGMRGHGGGGGGGFGGWGLMRSFRRDQSVTKKSLPAGLVKRIMRFAAPYKKMLVVFLVLIVTDALVGAANPLIYRSIIDDIGVANAHKTQISSASHSIIEFALFLGFLALADAVLSLWQRWISARIGEGLIFDMRSKVFSHFQQMPIAFFTRTQTGALV